nr:ATP-binding protein [Candidatus Woesebacteria bacterium]
MSLTLDTKTLWENALSSIEVSVSKANFATWFKDTFIVKIDDGIAVVGVPNTFVKDWLFNKYGKTILKTLRDQTDDIRAVEFVVANIEKARNQKPRPIRKDVRDNSELPLADYYINKEDNLNPKYTFDSFIIGSFNELAHAAAQAIIKQPGIVYNPLFIYGSTGHGKTHLIQAIGNKIKEQDKAKKVYYLTSEKFTSEYVSAIQQNKMIPFKEKYRKYDVLIMDDIQFLSDKDKTQEELFHLFNTLYDNNKQIVFSSDK